MSVPAIATLHWIVGVLGTSVILATPGYGFDNWLSLRDSGVVRQQKDYSCGAAALATVLTHFYLDPVSEASLLEQALEGRVADRDLEPRSQIKGLSFSELAALASARGYVAVGLDVSYGDLKKLKLPVIVALNVQGRAHFSVLRKIDHKDRVFLADPSWGNRQWGRDEFLKSFRRDANRSGGRILLVGAADARRGDDTFRHQSPRRVLIAPRE